MCLDTENELLVKSRFGLCNTCENPTHSLIQMNKGGDPDKEFFIPFVFINDV